MKKEKQRSRTNKKSTCEEVQRHTQLTRHTENLNHLRTTNLHLKLQHRPPTTKIYIYIYICISRIITSKPPKHNYSAKASTKPQLEIESTISLNEQQSLPLSLSPHSQGLRESTRIRQKKSKPHCRNARCKIYWITAHETKICRCRIQQRRRTRVAPAARTGRRRRGHRNPSKWDDGNKHQQQHTTTTTQRQQAS